MNSAQNSLSQRFKEELMWLTYVSSMPLTPTAFGSFATKACMFFFMGAQVMPSPNMDKARDVQKSNSVLLPGSLSEGPALNNKELPLRENGPP